jgi:hypothetical protein
MSSDCLRELYPFTPEAKKLAQFSIRVRFAVGVAIIPAKLETGPWSIEACPLFLWDSLQMFRLYPSVTDMSALLFQVVALAAGATTVMVN